MKNTEVHLNEVIESSIQQIVAATHAAAVAAVDRAFGRTNVPTGRATLSSNGNGRAMSPRRSPEEIAELAERFLEVAQAEPGQTMAALAPRLGVPPARLQVPIAHLKKQGQLKTAGQRQFKRYFPIGDVAATG
jgi:hypothetical protein